MRELVEGVSVAVRARGLGIENCIARERHN